MSANFFDGVRCVALAGGVGGSRMAHGLAQVVANLTVVVNTGDDFDPFGLRVCPDLDTVTYTLAGQANSETGWGVAGDTFHAMDALQKLGQDTWFRLGDRDLATAIQRTQMLRAGSSLTEVTRSITRALGVKHDVLPMCDAPVATWITTKAGDTIPFQDYFVKRGHRDEVAALTYRGIDQAVLSTEVTQALRDADLVIFCPSNPFLSIEPILSVPGMREALQGKPIVAVSPIVGGQAVRGPAADLLRSLGHEPSALGVARLYQGLVTDFVLDTQDAHLASEIEEIGMRAIVLPSIMRSEDDRAALARAVLQALAAPVVR